MHILVVEDHADLATEIVDYLGSLGQSVDAAADGPAGLRLATGGHYTIAAYVNFLEHGFVRVLAARA